MKKIILREMKFSPYEMKLKIGKLRKLEFGSLMSSVQSDLVWVQSQISKSARVVT